MNTKIQFTKIRDVKSPNRANKHDAGTDFFIPNFDKEFLKDIATKNKNVFVSHFIDEEGNKSAKFTIPPFRDILIPSGIKVNILDKNTYLAANNKSGVATKYKLDFGASVIDADYQGEIHIHVVNQSDKEVVLQTGQKIIQFIHKEYIQTQWEEISNEEYNKIETSDRGAGGFASTGEK